jgi:prepilin-type N-terminal cleavage/methylation domain-containing protein
MKKNFEQKNKGRKVLSSAKGFTIIETMIAISLFLVIVMAGMGALLNANLLHQKSQDMRSIIDNLSFVMEDMSRNLRTGYDYYCIPAGVTSFPDPSTPSSGQNCSGIAFESTANNTISTWVYEIVSETKGSVIIYYIRKSVDSGPWVQLTPDEVVIDTVASNFLVSGAESGDSLQPFVTIKLVGTITLKNNVVTPFSLQTSVSQRVLDR